MEMAVNVVLPTLEAWGRERGDGELQRRCRKLYLEFPALPLYVQDLGIDTATLGLIMAAWAVGKLIFEPIFGWWGDRHARKPQMVVALVLMSISIIAMLFVTSAAALLVLRFLSGIAAGMYDPAARGMLVQGTDEDERGDEVWADDDQTVGDWLNAEF